uniref:DUF834 domain-containing protein n=1 Tax=Oryza barthii TaxID=65489 RepID=A0A0D3HRE1_9ORYZ
MEAGGVGGQARVDEAEADGANREREVAVVVIVWPHVERQWRLAAWVDEAERMAPTWRGKSPPSSSMATRGKATEAGGVTGGGSLTAGAVPTPASSCRHRSSTPPPIHDETQTWTDSDG